MVYKLRAIGCVPVKHGMMRQWTEQIVSAWRNYWFSSESSVGFAIFRVAFGFILLLYHAPRLFYIRDLYTAEGYLVPMDLFHALALPIPNFPVAIALNIVLHFSILSFIVGYRTRLSTAVLLALHSYLSLLEYFSTIGMGAIISIYLFLLLVSPAGTFLSLDFALRRYREIMNAFSKIDEGMTPPQVPITMQRLMLWQLATIYFFNVLAKLQQGGWGWFTGRELWDIYSDTEYLTYTFVHTFIEKVLFILPNVTIMTIIGLSLLGVGILIPSLRPYAIFFGIIYHTVALFTLRVPITFSLLMISLYLITIEPRTWETWWGGLVNKIASQRVKLLYSSVYPFYRCQVAWLKSLDFFNQIKMYDVGSASATESSTVIQAARDGLLQEIYLVTASGKIFKGFFALQRLTLYLPHFWVLLPLLWLPGTGFIGTKIYQSVMRSQHAP